MEHKAKTVEDSHAFIKRAVMLGMPELQAEAVARHVHKMQHALTQDLITQDHLHAQILALKAEMLKWYIGVALAQMGGIIAALTQLPSVSGH